MTKRGSTAQIGLAMAFLLGAALVLFFFYALFANVPKVLAVVILIAGVAEMVLAARAKNRSRAAWAFLCSINATATFAFLFGGPILTEWLSRGAVLPYVPAIYCLLTTVALISSRDNY
jgi:hypothetical protein